MGRGLIGIFLVIGMLFPFWGNYLLIKKEICSIRREIRSEIGLNAHRNDLVLLEFTKKESRDLLDWKRDDEFKYKGEMYDVIQKEDLGDKVIYHCWPDKKEDKLNKELMALLLFQIEKDAPVNPQKNQLKQLFKKHFYVSSLQLDESTYELMQNGKTPYQTSCITVYPNIGTPPPENLA